MLHAFGLRIRFKCFFLKGRKEFSTFQIFFSAFSDFILFSSFFYQLHIRILVSKLPSVLKKSNLFKVKIRCCYAKYIFLFFVKECYFVKEWVLREGGLPIYCFFLKFNKFFILKCVVLFSSRIWYTFCSAWLVLFKYIISVPNWRRD
jgi:hypothetical protein